MPAQPGLHVANRDEMLRYRAAENARYAGIQARNAQVEADRAIELEKFEYQKQQDEANAKRAREQFEIGRTPTAWEQQKYDESKAARDLDVEAKRLDVEAKRNPTGIEAAKRVSPIDRQHVVNEFFKDWQFDPDSDAGIAYQKNPKAVNEMILHGVLQGKENGAIAEDIGASKQPETQTEGSLWWKKEVPVRKIDEMRIIPRPGITADSAIPSAVNRQPAAQFKVDSPEVAKARANIAVFENNFRTNRKWVESLPQAALEKVRDAYEVIQGADKQVESVGVTPQAPRGQVVPNEQLQDLNGDGKRDQMDKEIAAAFDYTDRVDAAIKKDPDFEKRLTPEQRKSLFEKRTVREAYASSYKKRKQAEMESAPGIVKQ